MKTLMGYKCRWCREMSPTAQGISSHERKHHKTEFIAEGGMRHRQRVPIPVETTARTAVAEARTAVAEAREARFTAASQKHASNNNNEVPSRQPLNLKDELAALIHKIDEDRKFCSAKVKELKEYEDRLSVLDLQRNALTQTMDEITKRKESEVAPFRNTNDIGSDVGVRQEQS